MYGRPALLDRWLARPEPEPVTEPAAPHIPADLWVFTREGKEILSGLGLLSQAEEAELWEDNDGGDYLEEEDG